MMRFNSIADVIALLERLRSAKIHYRLTQFRSDTLGIEVAVPGERWEIEIFGDGSVEVEQYRSDGTLGDATTLSDLFEKFSDE